MTNEQKIREAFERAEPNKTNYSGPMYIYFRAGYLALLNELEESGMFAPNKDNGRLYEPTYRLPEGVTKK